MTQRKQVWADEVPPILTITQQEMEDFFCACALHIGDPRDFPVKTYTPFGSMSRSSIQKFNEFFDQYFPNKKRNAFTYIHYMIWYEKEKQRLLK